MINAIYNEVKEELEAKRNAAIAAEKAEAARKAAEFETKMKTLANIVYDVCKIKGRKVFLEDHIRVSMKMMTEVSGKNVGEIANLIETIFPNFTDPTGNYNDENESLFMKAMVDLDSDFED